MKVQVGFGKKSTSSSIFEEEIKFIIKTFSPLILKLGINIISKLVVLGFRNLHYKILELGIFTCIVMGNPV